MCAAAVLSFLGCVVRVVILRQLWQLWPGRRLRRESAGGAPSGAVEGFKNCWELELFDAAGRPVACMDPQMGSHDRADDDVLACADLQCFTVLVREFRV